MADRRRLLLLLLPHLHLPPLLHLLPRALLRCPADTNPRRLRRRRVQMRAVGRRPGQFRLLHAEPIRGLPVTDEHLHGAGGGGGGG
eukprot:scaffold9264_cov51-Isochrysis_galbana.AAC.1